MFIQSLIPNFFYCLLDFHVQKYDFSLVQKGRLKINKEKILNPKFFPH